MSRGWEVSCSGCGKLSAVSPCGTCKRFQAYRVREAQEAAQQAEKERQGAARKAKAEKEKKKKAQKKKKEGSCLMTLPTRAIQVAFLVLGLAVTHKIPPPLSESRERGE